MNQSPSWETQGRSVGQNVPAFYGTQSSSPRSQEPTTAPCPEPDEPSPHPPKK